MIKNSSFPNTDRIYLTGFMGSGKSTMGKTLAGLLERTFVDLDGARVHEMGMTIPETFRREGDDALREMEGKVAAKFTSGKWVVALGGETLVNAGTRGLLIAGGTVVYLRAKAATLAARLSDRRNNRPLLAGSDPLERRIVSLLEARERICSNAQWILDKDDQTPEQ